MLCLFGAVLLTFQLIRLALGGGGGCWGFGFQSQPGTGLICSCCDFMLHQLKRIHTWPMICGPWQPELLPVGVCVRLCLDDTELIHSGEGKKTTTPEYLNVLTESGLWLDNMTPNHWPVREMKKGGRGEGDFASSSTNTITFEMADIFLHYAAILSIICHS